MRGFHYVLLALAIYFSVGLITAVSVAPVRESILANNEWLRGLGIALFVLGCIALRLAVHFKHWPSTAIALVVFYTSGFTLIGSTLAVSLQYDFDRDEEEPAVGLQRGQVAVCLGCAVSLLVFVIVQAVASNSSQPLQNAHTTTTTTTSAMQAAGLCVFLSALCVVILDDRVWDWRYAATVFASLILSVYLNAICTWMLILLEEENNINMEANRLLQQNAFHVTALIILQPILFAENWVLLCLLDSPYSARSF